MSNQLAAIERWPDHPLGPIQLLLAAILMNWPVGEVT